MKSTSTTSTTTASSNKKMLKRKKKTAEREETSLDCAQVLLDVDCSASGGASYSSTSSLLFMMVKMMLIVISGIGDETHLVRLARWWPVTVQNFWCPCYVQVFQQDKISSGGSICQEHNSICLGITIATTCGGLDSNFFFQKQPTREEVSRTKALSWKKNRQTLE